MAVLLRNFIPAGEEIMAQASPEFRAWHDALRAEEARKLDAFIEVKFREAHALRKVEGHKARERTLRSEEMARESQNPSQAPEQASSTQPASRSS